VAPVSLRTGLVALVVAASLGCGRPDLGITLGGIYDLQPDAATPSFILAVTIENRGDAAIVRDGPLVLQVRSVNTGGVLPVPVETRIIGDELPKTLAPGARYAAIYDLWRLGNLFGQDIFPELRRSPDDMRFRLVLETQAGAYESTEARGVAAAGSAVELLSKLERFSAVGPPANVVFDPVADPR
jgi:hypothetical protein